MASSIKIPKGDNGKVNVVSHVLAEIVEYIGSTSGSQLMKDLTSKHIASSVTEASMKRTAFETIYGQFATITPSDIAALVSVEYYADQKVIDKSVALELCSSTEMINEVISRLMVEYNKSQTDFSRMRIVFSVMQLEAVKNIIQGM